MQGGKVTEDFRMRAVLPTIRYLLEKGAKRIIIASHLGRPKGEVIQISGEKAYMNSIIEYSYSIFPQLSPPTPPSLNSHTNRSYQNIKFMPENRGISISGVLKSKNKKQALAYHQLSVHILGEKDFVSVLSDAEGKFTVALPKRYGNKELFLIANSLKDDQVEIKVNQDFCNKTMALSIPVFEVDDEERATLLQMAQKFGLQCLSGEEMLINQAVYAFMLFCKNNDFQQIYSLMKYALKL
jgi:hypothetical protein